MQFSETFRTLTGSYDEETVQTLVSILVDTSFQYVRINPMNMNPIFPQLDEDFILGQIDSLVENHDLRNEIIQDFRGFGWNSVIYPVHHLRVASNSVTQIWSKYCQNGITLKDIVEGVIRMRAARIAHDISFSEVQVEIIEEDRYSISIEFQPI